MSTVTGALLREQWQRTADQRGRTDMVPAIEGLMQVVGVTWDRIAFEANGIAVDTIAAVRERRRPCGLPDWLRDPERDQVHDLIAVAAAVGFICGMAEGFGAGAAL
ncbi:MAG: hypothetical protein IRZ28_11280 [Steroidobacteraceae bacterium]|nr:hypothetical protein [Steroidobacteraceae bacterium]